MAAEAERDRVAAVVKGCTEGPSLVEAAAKVVETTCVIVDLEREVVSSTALVEIGR